MGQRRYGGHKNNYRSALTAAARQYRSGHANADKNFQRAINAKVTMLKAQARSLAVSREAAYNKARALEAKGDKAGANAWYQKATVYQTRGARITSRINRYSNGTYVGKLASRYKSRLLKTGFKPKPGYGSTSTVPGTKVKPMKPGKNASYDYNSARKASAQFLKSARDAMRQYHQTGDPNKLQAARVAGVNRLYAKAQMYMAQANGLTSKANAAASKGDNAKAQQYATKAQKYEKRALGLANAANGLEQRMASGQLKTPRPRGAKAAKGVPGSGGKSSGIGGKSSGIPGYGEAIAEHKSLKQAYKESRQAASAAMKQYRKTGDPNALMEVRQHRYNRMQMRAYLNANRANRLYAKAEAAAQRGDKKRADLYTRVAQKYEKRAHGWADAAEKYGQRAEAGQLRTPKPRGTSGAGAMTARRPGTAGADDLDGPDGPDNARGGGDMFDDGPDDMFDDGPDSMQPGRTRTAGRGGAGVGVGAGAGGSVPQASDGETAPGLDGSQPQRERALPRIGSRRAYKNIKAQLRNNNNLAGALQTLKQMEKGGLFGRFRAWRARRKIVKQAYRVGKAAAKMGDVQKADEAVKVLGELKGKNNWRIRGRSWFSRIRGRGGIEDAALTAAKRMAKHRNPEGASVLLDFARQIQVARGRQEPTRRFRRIRRTAASKAWSALKRRAKEGNPEGFRSAMMLLQAYGKEDGRKGGMSRREFRKIRNLRLTMMKRSVPKVLKEAEKMLKAGYPAHSEEVNQRLAYAEETINKLSTRGITLRTGLFRRPIKHKFEKVHKLWAKGMMTNQTEPPKRGFFAKWYMMGGGQRGPSFMPTPRTSAQVSADKQFDRHKHQVQTITQQFQSGAITEEQANAALNKIPPQVLQQMGLIQ
jgi:hypothetical protein